jgi:hypothetical protein
VMTSDIDNFWEIVARSLTSYAGRIGLNESLLIVDIARVLPNANFPLRGFLSVRVNAHSDEIAITVDVQRVDDDLTIDSGIFREDGTLVSQGPSSRLASSGRQTRLDDVRFWLDEFETFLERSSLIFLNEIESIRTDASTA